MDSPCCNGRTPVFSACCLLGRRWTARFKRRAALARHLHTRQRCSCKLPPDPLDSFLDCASRTGLQMGKSKPTHYSVAGASWVQDGTVSRAAAAATAGALCIDSCGLNTCEYTIRITPIAFRGRGGRRVHWLVALTRRTFKPPGTEQFHVRIDITWCYNRFRITSASRRTATARGAAQHGSARPGGAGGTDDGSLADRMCGASSSGQPVLRRRRSAGPGRKRAHRRRHNLAARGRAEDK